MKLWKLSIALFAVTVLVGHTADAATVSFQEGVSPSGAYTADSVYIRNDGGNANGNFDDDTDEENIVGINGNTSAGLRALFEFDVSSIPSIASIDSVRFDVVKRAEAGVGTSITVALQDYGFTFAESTATWNDPDGDGNAGTGDTTTGGNISGATLSTATFDPSATSTGVGFLSTAAFESAVADAMAGDGVVRLIARRTSGSSNIQNFTRWYDETIGTASLRPKLTVEYSTPVAAYFNDLALGAINGQAGELGFSGNWMGSGTLDVIAGDLTAPVSTNFALTQSGTPQSLLGDLDNASGRAVNRALEDALTGTVWFTFLLNQPDAQARGGIDLNPSLGATGPTGIRIVAVGDDLKLLGGGLNESLDDLLTLGSTDLILGKIVIDASGNEALSIWINPDVENLLAADLFVNSANFLGAGGITALGVESYTNGGTTGGTIDLITFSDRKIAYVDVTGIPAPAALPAGLLFLASIAARRRRVR